MNLNSSKQSHFYNVLANLAISLIIVYRSSMLRPVMARSMSLDSKARPVVREPKRTTCAFLVMKRESVSC